jgi:hypothetical protein
MTLWLYDGAFCTPDRALPFEDSDDEWHDILGDPEIVPKDRKTDSPAICGAEYAAGSTSKHLSQVVGCHALVLDVDVWHDEHGNPRVTPFTLDDLKTIFEGFRFIAWNSFSSTEGLRKWRVVLPLAYQMPMSKYRPLWTMLNDRFLHNTMAESTKDPTRLGFCGTLGSQTGRDDYQYHVNPGIRLDWTQLDLTDDATPTMKPALKPSDFALAPDASSPTEALAAAKRYFRKVGLDIDVGDRHATLLQAAVRLWYDWAAPDEQFVFDVLKIVNDNFAEPKTDDEVWSEVQAGWDRTLGPGRVEQPSPYGNQREPLERASRTGMVELSRALAKKQREGSRIVSRAMKHAAAGEAFTTEPAEAKNVIHLLTKELASAYPKEKPERLLDILRPSLAAQRSLSTAYPVPTDEEVAASIRFTQNAYRKRAEEREQIRLDSEKRLVAQAFSYVGVERADPYTVAEYRKWEGAGFNHTQWILQNNREFYFWVNGGYYGPVRETEARNFFHVFLAPAKERVPCFALKEGIARRLPFDEVVQEYGSMIRDVERSFCHNKTSYDELTQRLVWGRLSMRPLDPLFDPDIDTWLRLLCREMYPLLEEWLVGLAHLDRTSAALLMTPPPQSGKNLFVYGVARLWTEAGPTALVDSEGRSFPAHHLERCPVVFCDERLPYMWAKEFSARIRASTSELSRTAKVPYVTDYTLTGAARYVFAGNSTSSTFAVKGFDSNAERSALADRLLIINHADDGARQFLGTKPHHRMWVESDGLARHIHWLIQNKPLSNAAMGKRFIGADVSGVAMDRVVTEVRAEKSADVLEWVHAFITRKRFSNEAVMTKGGAVYVSAPLVCEHWGLHDPTGKGIRSREVSTSLASLAPDRAKLGFADGHTGWYRKLDMTKLVEWLDANGFDFEPFAEALAELEKSRPFVVK